MGSLYPTTNHALRYGAANLSLEYKVGKERPFFVVFGPLISCSVRKSGFFQAHAVHRRKHPAAVEFLFFHYDVSFPAEVAGLRPPGISVLLELLCLRNEFSQLFEGKKMDSEVWFSLVFGS